MYLKEGDTSGETVAEGAFVDVAKGEKLGSLYFTIIWLGTRATSDPFNPSSGVNNMAKPKK